MMLFLLTPSKPCDSNKAYSLILGNTWYTCDPKVRKKIIKATLKIEYTLSFAWEFKQRNSSRMPIKYKYYKKMYFKEY